MFFSFLYSMNFWNHFLTSFSVLYLIFQNRTGVIEIFVFAVVFGVLIDADQLIGYLLGKPEEQKSLWIHEPFGFLFFGVPIASILLFFNTNYFLMSLIPYALHIIQDYLTIHVVRPLAPFSNKIRLVGWIRAWPAYSWYTSKHKGISENYYLLANLCFFVLVFFVF